jgi:hypothetical protein
VRPPKIATAKNNKQYMLISCCLVGSARKASTLLKAMLKKGHIDPLSNEPKAPKIINLMFGLDNLNNLP